MSFESPISWTDVNYYGDNEAWDTRKNKLLYPALEMLRLALNERYKIATGGDLPTTVYQIKQGMILNYEWFRKFDEALNIIIANFVNHTINNGDFTGLATIPHWSKQQLIDYIGDDNYYSVDQIVQSKWIMQRYKIINLLRWINWDTTYIDNFFTITNYQGYYSYPDMYYSSWDSAKNAIISGYSSHDNFYETTFGIYINNGATLYHPLPTKKTSFTVNKKTTEYEFKYDCYTQAWLYDVGYPFNPYTFIEVGGIVQGYTRISADNTGSVNIELFKDADILSLSEPAADNRSYSVRLLSWYNGGAILKFNIEGGFQFQDNSI